MAVSNLKDLIILKKKIFSKLFVLLISNYGKYEFFPFYLNIDIVNLFLSSNLQKINDKLAS